MAAPRFGACLPLAFLLGCGVDAGQWDHVPIEQAWLEEFDLSSLTMVAGTMQGDALLVFQESSGTTGSLPVHLGGGALGAAFDLSADVEGHEGAVDIRLQDVRDPTVGDVLGTYHGTGGAGAAFIGGSRRRMKNGQGASFREDHFVVGISVFVGYEWITIREGGDDGVVPTNEPPLLDTSPPDGTGDTGVPPADTAPAIPVQEQSAGCDPETVAAETESEPSGCDCSDDGNSSSSASRSCSQGRVAPFGVAWVALLIRRRLRRR